MEQFSEGLFRTKGNTVDDKRRGRLLVILLVATAVLVVLGMASILLLGLLGDVVEGAELAYFGGLLMLFGIVTIFLINRYISVTFASTLFIILFSLVVTFDTPQEVVGGRSLFFFALPILIASLIVRPFASFITAIWCGVIVNIVALSNGLSVNAIGPLAFMMVALVSWLGSSSLEDALEEARILNVELDARVAQRTAELQLANDLLVKQAGALEVARDEALAASRFKSRMLANVSHELRTPLGAILGFAEMMVVGYLGPVGEKQVDALEKIIQRVKGLSRLVGDLLDQAKLESGTIALHSTWWEPATLMSEVKDSLNDVQKSEAVTVVYEIDPDLPAQLFGDYDRILQIMLNLTTNALKFTDTGEVRLRMYRPQQDYWAIDVSDTGLGIPHDDLQTIFEAFQQVDGSTTRRHAGFGLGLSIVRQLTIAMGGDVTVESIVGQGSIFTVMIPLPSHTAVVVDKGTTDMDQEKAIL